MDDTSAALYQVGEVRVRPRDQEWQSILERAYERGLQPLCLCRPCGVPMYISRYDQFVAKRMPDTGHRHHPSCPSFEQLPGQSGLGEVLGDAVLERSPDRVEVLLDFPLSRRPGRPAPASGSGSQPTEAVAHRRKLGLRGLVDLLLQRAGFNRWYPRMQGKRTWFVVRKHLLAAASEIAAKGMRLSDRLFIPEPFSLDQASEIASRRAQAMAILLSPDSDASFRLMLVMSELKEFSATEVDYRIVLRHMPDCPLYMERKAGDRFKAIFERGFEAWAHQRSTEQGGHMNPARLRFLFCGLIRAKHEDHFVVDTATLVLFTANWIPIEQPYERLLVDELVGQQRRFLRPLPFESRRAAAYPNAVLLDTGDTEIALDILTPFMSDRDRSAKQLAISRRPKPAWVWSMHEELSLPPLPPKA